MLWAKWRGKLFYLLTGLALAAAIAYGFMPKPVPVELAKVSNGSLVVSIEEEGKTRVRDRYMLSAPVSGHARRIDLKVGDPVATGQVVAHIEPARSASLDPRSRAQAAERAAGARNAWKAAEETARATAAEQELAKQELTRAESLGQARFISQAAIDQARSRLQAAHANRQAAEHTVESARHEAVAAQAALLQVSMMVSAKAGDSQPLRAPVAGQVLAVPHESEGAVVAGQPLLEIGNPETLEIVVEVLSTAAVKIQPGMTLNIDRWGGEGRLEGRVRRVEPAGFTKISALGVEEQRVRVLADLSTPHTVWQRLGDAYRVETAFVLWEGKDVLQVPNSALFRQGEHWAAFVHENGHARLRTLRIGQRNNLSAQVIEGLNVGDEVVVHPDEKLRDGGKIRPRQ